jgi:RNA polymerase sigma-70 factor (ECF subfamily)
MTDASRFEAFVLKHQDMVFATAVRLLGSPVEAEDIAQTVFLKAFQRFEALRDSPAAAGWLKTVTTNACLNHLTRYRARWRFFSELDRVEPGGSDTLFEETLVSPSSPAIEVQQAEEHERMEQALRRLPDHQRVALVLFHVEGLSYQAIAALLGVSLGKVKTDIHRGRDALKRQIAEAHAVG